MRLPVLLIALAACLLAVPLDAADGGNVLSVSGSSLLLNGQPVKLRGLRLSNALVSDAEVGEVIANLPIFKNYGINAFSAFLMGSRFGDIKGFRPDASVDPVYGARLVRLIEAADRENMVILVGALYWSTSTANDDLAHWTQADANRAVANLCSFVRATGRRNVFIDPDNEGMANVATGWSIGQMIDAGHAAAPGMIIGWNARATPSAGCDLSMHFGARIAGKPWLDTEAVPENAPGGYWGSYSKKSGYYNYINIGIYSDAMKTDQWNRAVAALDGGDAGYFCASTWLQCVAPYGPNHVPGGQGTSADPGIRWYLERLKTKVGPWTGIGTAPAPAIQGLLLMDADSDSAICELVDGMTVDLALHPRVAVVAAADAATGSVRFGLDGNAAFRTENTAPYALHGDSAGDLAPWTPALGSHRIEATPASADGFAGTRGATRAITISVVRGAAAPPVAINFQPASAPAVSGGTVDGGLVYGARGGGLAFGWSRDIAATARDRGLLGDQVQDTLLQPMHASLGATPAVWELALPPGLYEIHLIAGDPAYQDSVYALTLEGATVLTGTPSAANRLFEATVQLLVDDGRLTLGHAGGAVNNKVCAIEVAPVPSGVN